MADTNSESKQNEAKQNETKDDTNTENPGKNEAQTNSAKAAEEKAPVSKDGTAIAPLGGGGGFDDESLCGSTVREIVLPQDPPDRKSEAREQEIEKSNRIIQICQKNCTTETQANINKAMNEEDVEWLIETSRAYINAQPNLLRLKAPIQVIGDIHGQYTDLIRIFELTGWPPQSKYLFLGDYVDRGRRGIECCVLLLALKVRYPEQIFLLRGNHECAAINRVYGFYAEVKLQYSVGLWMLFADLFDYLPIAAIIGDRIFCIHGGLSPDLESVDDIDCILRPAEVPNAGMLCDFLWSDPDADVEGWAQSDRGVSHTFGPDVVEAFLEMNDFDLIVRAHQVVEDGYEFFAQQQLVTLFSAPNYCNEFDNAGAIMTVSAEMLVSFVILEPLNVDIQFTYAGVSAVY